MSDFDVAIPKVPPVSPEGGDGDDGRHRRPHWSNVARTLLNNQLAYCESSDRTFFSCVIDCS